MGRTNTDAGKFLKEAIVAVKGAPKSAEPKADNEDLLQKKRRKRVEKFLRKLPRGADSYAFKDIATALYAAFHARQETLLSYLRSGALVASIHWPSTRTFRIPPALWHDFPDEEFKVRWRRKGTWERRTCRIPLTLLHQHLATPLMEFVAGVEEGKTDASTSAVLHILGLSDEDIAENLARDRSAFLTLLKSIAMEMQSSENEKRRPFISPSDLHAFSYGTLGPAYREKKKGRPARGSTEELIL